MSAITPVCYYASWGAYALGWTHFTPAVMTLIFSVMSLVYADLFWLIIGLYFKAAAYVLGIAQLHLQVMRPDPYCAVYHTYAYPSTETFYLIAMLTFLITYVLTDERPCRVGIYGWLCAFSVAFLPPVWLVYTHMNTWQEIVSTVIMAIVPTVLFMLLLRYAMQPAMKHLVGSPPFSWFGYESQFLFATD